MNKRDRIENMLLGKILLYNYEIKNMLDLGVTEKWFSDFNASLFLEMKKLYLEHGKISITSLDISDELIEILTDYGVNCYTELAVNDLRKIIEDEYIKKVIEENIFKDNTKSLEEKILKVQGAFYKVQKSKDENYEITNNKEDLTEWLNSLEEEKIDGIEAPYKEMRPYFNFYPGNLVVIGARPSMGKSALAIALGKEISRKEQVLFITFEMSKKEIYDRLIASEGDVALSRLKFRNKTDYENARLSKAIGKISQLKFNLMVAKGNKFEMICEKIKSEHQRNPLKVVIIDYLTLMTTLEYFQNRNLQVEFMANGFKRLALELNITIVLLAQLNRENKDKRDKRPQLYDLRDSGGIEQAADIVGMIHREDYYNDELKKENYVEMEFLIRKNRQGPLGTVKLGYNKSTQNIS